MKLNHIALLASLLLSSAIVSCSKDDDEPNSDATSGIANIMAAANDEWSSQFYLGAKLFEIHSDVPNYQLICSAPEGYQVELVKMDQTDSRGLYVYYVEVDMDAIQATTSTNQCDTIKIPFTLKGSVTKNKTRYDVSAKPTLTIIRYLCPEVSDSTLVKDWTLIHDNSIVFSDWISFNPEGDMAKYDFGPDTTFQTDNSPLHIFAEQNAEGDSSYLFYTNTSANLPGWLQSTDDVHLPLSLSEGLWKTGANPEPAVYYVSDTLIRCMSIEYNEDGDMVAVHRYTFTNP